MPAKDRRVARILTSLAANNRAPEVFFSHGPLPLANPRSSQPGLRVTGRQSVVRQRPSIEAARQAGTLDQLAKEAQAVADLKDAQKVENAGSLLSPGRAARGEGAKVAPLGSRLGWPS